MGTGIQTPGQWIRENADLYLPDRNNLSSWQKINFVASVATSTCTNVQWFNVETFFPAALEAGIAFFDFDELDVVRFVLRPRGLKRGGHLRAGWTRRAARNSTLLRMLQDRKYSDGIRHLWVMDTALQRIFFWWMVFEIVTDFAYNWSTLAIRNATCGPGSAGRRSISPLIFTLGAWNGGHFQQTTYDSATVQSIGAGFNALAAPVFATAGMNVFNPNKTATQFSLRIQITTATGVISDFATTSVSPQSAASLAVNARSEFPGAVAAEVKTEGFALDVDSGDFFCQGGT